MDVSLSELQELVMDSEGAGEVQRRKRMATTNKRQPGMTKGACN